jgi:hypothetical protein
MAKRVSKSKKGAKAMTDQIELNVEEMEEVVATGILVTD